MKIALALALAVSYVGVAEANSTASDVTDAAACVRLNDVDFSNIQDAPTQVTSAKVVEDSKDAPAHCLVEGYVAPQVGVQVGLPLSHWNGKLAVVGNGGWAGVLNDEACERYIKQGYACVTTDTGHKGRGDDGLWAVNNLPAQVDFGYRAIHVATLAAKAIINRYYSKAPEKSYFLSCSTGGYQGLVEAQRFPWDFNGIVAGAPDMDEADLTMRDMWAHRSFFDKNGQPTLDTHALKVLHEAVLAECDRDDGVQDGIVGNPLSCRFKPSKLLCKAGQTDGCLTSTQIDAAQRIYDGPPHLTGHPAVRGALAGSEHLWGEKFFGFSSETGYFDNLFKYMIYGASPGWDTATYDYDRDYQRLGLGALYTDTNPDLRSYKAAGGKLISYQGGTDILEMPTAIVDYYQTVERVIGTRQATQDFFRLFVIPGMNHCSGGIGAYTIDYLSYIEAWVERNQPPDAMIGAHVSDAYLASLPLPDKLVSQLPPDMTPALRIAVASGLLRVPLDPAIPIAFTRPMYPYPLYAKYKSGDPNKAESFRPVLP